VPLESALEGSLEGSRGDRALVPNDTPGNDHAICVTPLSGTQLTWSALQSGLRVPFFGYVSGCGSGRAIAGETWFRCTVSLFGLKRCLTVCSHESLDVSALIMILFRPVLSVAEWAGCGSAGVGGVPVSGGMRGVGRLTDRRGSGAVRDDAAVAGLVAYAVQAGGHGRLG
ncbi:MAG: hypothetical protein QOD10_3891, partial [Mycobacterium sp.]|nr:hypothetical protein [Mycobacterium sp.]